MEKKIFYAKPVRRCGDDLAHAWKYTMPVYRAAPHVWQVGGQDDVCAYLLDTGEGLILIDTGYRASLYLLVDRIWRAGFDPAGLKHILLSHWHWDHVNGCPFLKQMSGARVWISREDEKEHRRFRHDTEPFAMSDYEADSFYDDDKTIELGRFCIHTRLCPGHTPGSTSFWFEDRDEETGRTYICAMHGGLGVGMMHPDELKKAGYPEAMAHRFVKDCRELAGWKVDIMLPSHLNQGNVAENMPADRNDYRVFVGDYAWRDVLLNRAGAVMQMYPDIYQSGAIADQEER